MVADMYTQDIREDLIRAGVDKDHAAIDRVTDRLVGLDLARNRRDGSMFESISANATKPHPGTT
jgi:hypothetical protein